VTRSTEGAGFLWLSGLCALGFFSAPTGQDAGLVLRGAHVLAPSGDAWLEATDVVVDEGRIAWIGSSAELPEAWRTARVLRADDRYLVPGFLDTHVHVGHVPFLSDEQHETRPDLVALYLDQMPRSYLYFGFTTLVDLDLGESARARFESAPVAPELHGGGRGIRLFDGYGPRLMPPEVRYRVFPVWTFNAEQADLLPADVRPEEHAPEALVRRLAASGGPFVKTYHEPGFGGAFSWPVPTHDTLARLVDTAHELGLPVVLHATGLESHVAGLDAGVDVLAHGLWHWPGSRLDPRPPAEVLAVVRRIASEGVALQPTARVLLGEADTWSASLLEHEHFADVTPPEIVAWLETDEGRWAQASMTELYDRLLPELFPEDRPAPEELLAAMNARVLHMLSAYRKEGVRVIFGSDTPASEGVGNPPGLNGYLEIQAWEEAGWKPVEILRALTLENARAFGLDDRKGSIEVDKDADLLVLTADPLRDVRALDAIERILVRGVAHEREEFSARRR
jgi:imidazolonepropionase-like amidohydrolase